MKPLPVLLVLTLVLTGCFNRVHQTPDDSFQLERNSEFDGAVLRFFVTLDDGTEVSVNTADDVFEALPGAAPVPGHQARAWTFLKDAKDGTSLAHSLLSWNPDDPTDYLMFGWWAQFPDQHLPNLVLDDETPRFAIVDGPELDHGIVPEVPIVGTATYAGPAGGLYLYEFGTDWGELEGTRVIDEYQGTVTLTADFEDGTVRGCVGCVGDLVTTRAHFGAILGGGVVDMQGLATDYELHLATAIFREDGMFERDRVTLRHPERTVTHSEGDWGGAVSSRQDTDGNPRLIAGFSSVFFEESDGSEGEFFGSFLGLSESFRETGESGPLPESED